MKPRYLLILVVVLSLTAASCSSDSSPEAGVADPAEVESQTGNDDDAAVSSPATSDDGSESGTSDSASSSGEVRHTLKIGYAYPDVSAFAILNDKFSLGDPEIQADGVLQAWRRDGILPLNGIDIELVYVSYNILSADDQLGACTTLVQDEDVFAVIAGRDFQVGADCLTTRFQIPVIDSSGLAPAAYERSAPWLFTVRANESEIVEAFVTWADQNNLLEGKTIGVFWDTRSEDAKDTLEASLEALGYELASELASDGEGIGSPQDQIVVQRFQADGVDLPVLLVSTSSVTNFLASAEQQNYEPTLVALEWANQLTDISTAAYPQAFLDGMPAMATSRLGEIAAGFDLPEAAVTCIDNYQRFSGEDVELASPENGETVQILFTCDLMSILLEGIRNAGDDPTPEGFVASLEMISDLELAAWGNVTFTADDHAGVNQIRTVRWSTDCECWTAEGDPVSVDG